MYSLHKFTYSTNVFLAELLRYVLNEQMLQRKWLDVEKELIEARERLKAQTAENEALQTKLTHARYAVLSVVQDVVVFTRVHWGGWGSGATIYAFSRACF